MGLLLTILSTILMIAYVKLKIENDRLKKNMKIAQDLKKMEGIECEQ